MHLSVNPPAGMKRGVSEDDARTPQRLLVYQMAKVASMSWVALGREHFSTDEIFHTHHLANESVGLLAALNEETGPNQTIARRMILRTMARSGSNIRALLNASRERSEPWLVVTGIREPVARSVSMLFYFGDFFGCTTRRLSWRNGATIEMLQHGFREMWDCALANQPPTDTFGRLIYFFLTDFEAWFEREFRAVLGIDVMGATFRPGPEPRVLAEGQTKVLVYRVEDLPVESPGHVILRDSVKSFLNVTVASFPVVNATRGRRTDPLYRTFLEQLQMPPELLDRIYSGPTVRKFYLPAEIEAFKSRWAQQGPGYRSTTTTSRSCSQLRRER